MEVGLGLIWGGLVARGSRAPPEAVPRITEVASTCGAQVIMAGTFAKAGVVRAKTQVVM